MAYLDVCCRSVDSTFKAELEVDSIVVSTISTSLLRLLEAVDEDVDVVMASGVDSSMRMELACCWSPVVIRYILSSKKKIVSVGHDALMYNIPGFHASVC